MIHQEFRNVCVQSVRNKMIYLPIWTLNFVKKTVYGI